MDFATAASQNDVSIKGHIIILFHEWQDDSNKKSNDFCDFMKDFGFLKKEKLLSTESVMWWSR